MVTTASSRTLCYTSGLNLTHADTSPPSDATMAEIQPRRPGADQSLQKETMMALLVVSGPRRCTDDPLVRCILPVLPFVFARAGRPFIRAAHTLPMLAGMAITFAAIATLAAVGGSWAVHANEYGRYAAIILLAVFGVTLVSPQLATRVLTRPIVALANKSPNSTGGPILVSDGRQCAHSRCCNRVRSGHLAPDLFLDWY